MFLSLCQYTSLLKSDIYSTAKTGGFGWILMKIDPRKWQIAVPSFHPLCSLTAHNFTHCILLPANYPVIMKIRDRWLKCLPTYHILWALWVQAVWDFLEKLTLGVKQCLADKTRQYKEYTSSYICGLHAGGCMAFLSPEEILRVLCAPRCGWLRCMCVCV